MDTRDYTTALGIDVINYCSIVEMKRVYFLKLKTADGPEIMVFSKIFVILFISSPHFRLTSCLHHYDRWQL